MSRACARHTAAGPGVDQLAGRGSLVKVVSPAPARPAPPPAPGNTGVTVRRSQNQPGGEAKGDGCVVAGGAPTWVDVALVSGDFFPTAGVARRSRLAFEFLVQTAARFRRGAGWRRGSRSTVADYGGPRGCDPQGRAPAPVRSLTDAHAGLRADEKGGDCGGAGPLGQPLVDQLAGHELVAAPRGRRGPRQASRARRRRREGRGPSRRPRFRQRGRRVPFELTSAVRRATMSRSSAFMNLNSKGPPTAPGGSLEFRPGHPPRCPPWAMRRRAGPRTWPPASPRRRDPRVPFETTSRRPTRRPSTSAPSPPDGAGDPPSLDVEGLRSSHGRVDAWLDRWPPEDATLTAYLAELHDQGTATSTASTGGGRRVLPGPPSPVSLAGYQARHGRQGLWSTAAAPGLGSPATTTAIEALAEAPALAAELREEAATGRLLEPPVVKPGVEPPEAPQGW